MQARLANKGIKGNLVGEGLIQGGVIIVSPSKGIVLCLPEVTGSDLPYDQIDAAVLSLGLSAAFASTPDHSTAKEATVAVSTSPAISASPAAVVAASAKAAATDEGEEEMVCDLVKKT